MCVRSRAERSSLPRELALQVRSLRIGPLYVDRGDASAVSDKPIPPEGTAPAGGAAIHVADGEYAVASLGNMVFIAWRGETRVAAIANAKRILVQTIAQRYTRYALMQYVEQGAAPPSAAARSALAEMLIAGRGRIVCSSLVYPGTGFWAASARAFVTGLNLLARPGFPHVVFSTVQEAARWHVQRLEKEAVLTQEDICKSVDAMRAALDRAT